MGVMTAVLTELMAAGLVGDALLSAMARIEATMSADVRGRDADIIAARREKDRIRKALKRATPAPVSVDLSVDKAMGGRGESVFLSSLRDSEKKEDSELETARESPRTKLGTRLPATFIPDKTVQTAARDRHFSRREWETWLAGFFDYWAGVPGQKGRKLDWQATARNSVRSHRINNGVKTNGNGTFADSLRGAVDLLDRKYGQPEELRHERGGDDLQLIPGLPENTERVPRHHR